jgi:hypothetical protein
MPLLLYIDPGTGSVLLQGLAAAFLIAGMFWRRIQMFFKKYLLKGLPDKTKR